MILNQFLCQQVSLLHIALDIQLFYSRIHSYYNGKVFFFILFSSAVQLVNNAPFFMYGFLKLHVAV